MAKDTYIDTFGDIGGLKTDSGTGGDNTAFNPNVGDQYDTGVDFDAWASDKLNPDSPNYVGPGYEKAVDPNTGHTILQRSKNFDQYAYDQWKTVSDHAQAIPEAPTYVHDGENGVTPTTAPPVDTSSLNPYGSPSSPTAATIPQGVTRPIAANSLGDVFGDDSPLSATNAPGSSSLSRVFGSAQPGASPQTAAPAPGSQAPTVDNTAIDASLSKLDTLGNQINVLANTGQDFSKAEAQMAQGQQLARLNAAIQLDASQRAALGTARSARSVGDRALAEKNAVGESTFLGQEGARNAALQEAQFVGDKSSLRADEETAKATFKLNALSKAADLGLNTTSMLVDISKADVASANNWINNEFQQLGLNKQLTEQQAQDVLGFTKDMAALQFDYDKMDSDEQDKLEQRVLDKYNIDQQTAVALKKIKQDGKFHWDQFLSSMVGGASSGAGGVFAKALIS